MKIKFYFVLVSFFFISCGQKIDEKEVDQLNGYWEIEKVIFENGQEKEYGMNENYDFFQIDKNHLGFRKKVKPQLDGTFLVNNTKENLKLRFESGKVYIDYVTVYAQWTEELIAISKEKMICLNKEGDAYHYKKASAINITENGQKTK